MVKIVEEPKPVPHDCPGCGKLVRWALRYCAPCSREKRCLEEYDVSRDRKRIRRVR
jgi:uncharacterized OB-fold protein